MNKLKSFMTWMLLLVASHVMAINITVDPIEIEAGKTAQLVINLSNTETNLTAYQMFLYLPEGVAVQKKANGKYAYTTNGDRHDGAFTVSVKDAEDGSVLITCFSADKDVLTGSSGELIRLPIEVASTVTTSLQASLKNIEVTDINAKAYKPADVTFNLKLKGEDVPPVPSDDVKISVDDLTVTAGGTADLVINMETSLSNLTAYQMFLYLPEGVAVQKKANGKYAYTTNSDRHDGAFTVSVKDAEDGSVLITCFSADKDVLTASSGELIRLPIEVASTVAASLQASLKNIEVTDINAKAYKPADVTFNLKVDEVPPGPTDEVKISVDDLTVTAGGTADLVINMETSLSNLTAYQMFLYLPEGVAVQKKANGKYAYTTNGDRHDGAFTVSVKDAEDGSVLITCFSADKDVLTGSSGELIRLPIEVASTVTASLQASLKNIEVTDINAKAYKPADVTFNLKVDEVPPGPTDEVKISVDDLTVTAGGTADLVINMETSLSNLTAYQMFLYLPEGVTVQKKANGKYAYTTNSDRHDGAFTVSVKDAEDGSVLITCFSADKDVLTGSNGELIRLPIEVASTVTTSLQASLKNIEVTDINAKAYKPTDVTINLKVDDVPPGPTDEVKISVDDLTVTAGGTADLVINMATDLSNLTAYQMFLYLPEGVAVQKKANGKYAYTTNSDRHDGAFTVSVKDAEDGSVLITCFSADKDVLTGSSGELIRLPIEVASTVTASLQASLKNIEVTDINAKAYKPADVTFNITSEPEPAITITAKSYERVYGDANPKFTYTVEGGTLDGEPEISCAATAKSDIGEYDIVVSQGTVKNYKVEYVGGKLTITKAPLTIKTEKGTYTRNEGEDNPEFKLLYAGFKNGETEEVLTKKPTVTCDAQKDSPAGEYAVKVSGAEAKNYSITHENGKLIVSSVPVIVITAKNQTRVYGDDNPTLQYTVEGGTLDGTPEISCAAKADSDVGEYDIMLSQGTVKNYKVEYVGGKLTVTKAPLTIKTEKGTYTRSEGEENPEFKLVYAGFKNGETEKVLTKKPTVTCDAKKDSPAGEYAVKVSGAEAKNYSITYENGKLIVSSVPVIVITAKNQTRVYGDDNPTLEYTVEGGTLDGTPEISCAAKADSDVGEYDIMLSQGTVKNYKVEYVGGKLTVTKAPLTIKAGTYYRIKGEDNPEFTLSYEGWKNNETEAELTKRPTVTTTATKESGEGIYEVKVSGAEAQNYNISYVNGTLEVFEVKYTLSPADKSELLSLKQITLTFSYPDEVTIADKSKVTLKDAKGTAVAISGVALASGSKNKVNITFAELAPGTYTLNVAEGAFTYTLAETKKNVPAITATYTVPANPELRYTLSPASDSEHETLSSVTLAISSPAGATLKDASKVTLVDVNKKAVTIQVRATDKAGVFHITFDKLAVGTYTLTAAQGAFVYTLANTELEVGTITATYTVAEPRPSEVVLAEAAELLKNTGLGYPTADSEARDSLSKLVEAGRGTDEVFTKAMDDFYAETNVVMPAVDKYYHIIAITAAKDTAYVNQQSSLTGLVESEAEATPLKLTKSDKEGAYLLTTADGQQQLSVTISKKVNTEDTKSVFGLFSIDPFDKMKAIGFTFAEVDKADIPVPQIELALTPKSGTELDVLDKVKLAFNGYNKVDLADATKIELVKGEATMNPEVAAVEGSTNEYVLTFGIDEPGTYTLVIGKGAFTFDYADLTHEIDAVIANYVVKVPVGIASPFVLTNQSAVYTLSGQKSKRPHKGINIVRGRKVVVK